MLHSLRLNVNCIWVFFFFFGCTWSCCIVEVFISFIHLASNYNVYVLELMLTNSALIFNYDVNMVWKNYLYFEEQGILLYAINMGLNASYFSLMLNTFMIHSLSFKFGYELILFVSYTCTWWSFNSTLYSTLVLPMEEVLFELDLIGLFFLNSYFLRIAIPLSAKWKQGGNSD